MVSGFNWSLRSQEFILSIQKMDIHSPPPLPNQLSKASVLRSCHLPRRFHGLQRQPRRLVIETSPSHERTSTVDWFFAKLRHGWWPWQPVFLRKTMKKPVPFFFVSQIYDGFLKKSKRRSDFTSWGSLGTRGTCHLEYPIVIQRLRSRSRIGLCSPCPNLPGIQSINLVASTQNYQNNVSI